MNYQEHEAKRTAWMEASAQRHRHDDYSGHVVFCECQLCGNLVWRSTSKNGEGYSVEPMANGDCSACRESLTRAPELATWAINVAHKAATDAVREILESNSVINGRQRPNTDQDGDRPQETPP